MSHVIDTGDQVAYNDAKHVVVKRLLGFPAAQLMLANLQDGSILHANVANVALTAVAHYHKDDGGAIDLDAVEAARLYARGRHLLDTIRRDLDELEMLCPGRDPRERYRRRVRWPERFHDFQIPLPDTFAREYLGDWSLTGRLVDKGAGPCYQNIPAPSPH